MQALVKTCQFRLYNNCSPRAVWILRGEVPPVQPKANLHEKKCLLFSFWDAKGHAVLRVSPARENGQCYYLLQSVCLASRALVYIVD
uniref:Uncharacterized protein n=1 Tax=Caenorhabditis japonica TaxID=281687 RepID=A0A8R1DQ94_CAEJA